jgi:hypothetical protein
LRAAPSSGLGTPLLQGAGMGDDDDYELMMWAYLIAHLVVFLLALVGIAGLAGFLWGML